jgi:hypothetical protein
MSADPEIVPSSGTVELVFSGELATLHGGYFVLVDQSGREVAGLWSDQIEEGIPGYTTDLATFEILDFGVLGPGPDHVVLPPDLPPGTYQICTENSRPERCASITIQ